VDKLSKQGEDSRAQYGQLQSFFSLVQTFGSFLVGILLDRLGAKTGFIFVFVGSALSYGLLAYSTSMSMLYLSKVPALLQHAFLVAQALVSVSVPEEDLDQALGFLMTAYTIGATVGPFVGGLVGATGDYYLGAKLAAAGSILSVLLTLLIPSKDTLKDDHKDEGKKKKQTESTDAFQSLGVLGMLKQIITHPVVVCVLLTKLVSSIANSVAQATKPMVLKNEFGVLEAGMGLSMSVGMAANAFSGAFLVGALKGRLSRSSVVSLCLLVMVACHCAAAAVAPSTPLLGSILEASKQLGMEEWVHPSLAYIFFGILGSVFAFVMATVLTAVSTSAVPDSHRGSLMGIEHGMFSLARVGTPTAGSYVLITYGTQAVSFLSAGVILIALIGWKFVASPRIEKSQARTESGRDKKHS